jgi:hypothetical protein
MLRRELYVYDTDTDCTERVQLQDVQLYHLCIHSVPRRAAVLFALRESRQLYFDPSSPNTGNSLLRPAILPGWPAVRVLKSRLCLLYGESTQKQGKNTAWLTAADLDHRNLCCHPWSSCCGKSSTSSSFLILIL